CGHAVRSPQRAFVNCRPCHCVSGRWFIAPVLAVLERDMQIVDSGRRTNGTRSAAELAEYDASRPFVLDILRRDVLALGGRILLRCRQGQPKLVSLERVTTRSMAIVPHPAAWLQPF